MNDTTCILQSWEQSLFWQFLNRSSTEVAGN